MKETLNFKKDISFNNNIAEICSISLECEYNVDNSTVNGNFLVEGAYRSHEISLNQENFSYKLPFTYELSDRAISDSVIVNVKDFTYTIDSNELNVDIEYDVEYETKTIEEFEDEKEFDRFLSEHEVDLINLNDLASENEEVNEENKIIEPIIEEEETTTINEASRNLSDSIINGITKDENYITYHIYICNNTDTLESVSAKYNISIDLIKNYNSIDEIGAGTKLIIPYIDE